MHTTYLLEIRESPIPLTLSEIKDLPVGTTVYRTLITMDGNLIAVTSGSAESSTKMEQIVMYMSKLAIQIMCRFLVFRAGRPRRYIELHQRFPDSRRHPELSERSFRREAYQCRQRTERKFQENGGQHISTNLYLKFHWE